MKNCIIIVDVQQGFINNATKHIPKLVENLQNEYKHIYITRFFNRQNSLYRKLIKWHKFDKNSDSFQLAFEPAKQAIIIDKDIYSCVNPEFIQELNAKKIKKVDVCGIDTDICVTKCCVDLFEAGIIPRVLANYCASNAGLKEHNFALKTLSRFIGKNQVII